MSTFLHMLDDISRELSSRHLILRGDKIGHFFAGMIIFWISNKIFKSGKTALFTVFALELFKELVIDLTITLQKKDYLEPATDIIATLLGAGFYIWIRKLKRKKEHPESKKISEKQKKTGINIGDFLE